ncbi:MAG: LPS-assembly protein LptD [candidate division Zixibacteria bacterium]|nr:LPS-assembly protein LptD [candidate division Zixibacteria bacterium]
MPKSAAWLIFLLLCGGSLMAQSGGRRLQLQHADKTEWVPSKLQDTTFVVGSVIFQMDDGMVYCDSAIWMQGKRVKLKGRVIVDDPDYHLAADSIDYDLLTNKAIAAGSYVEIWSRRDSVFATGIYAFYDRSAGVFVMRRQPTIYLNYPDSANLIRVDADSIRYDGESHLAEAIGHSIITSKDIRATAGVAQMYTQENRLELEVGPVVSRSQSKISGKAITVLSRDRQLHRIEVHDSARGEFNEPAAEDSTQVDRSIITGKEIVFGFDSGELKTVTCSNQAYSWYLPWDRGKKEGNENSVSGDTIIFEIDHEKLRTVDVEGGAIGRFLSTTREMKDTTVVTKTDTIDYKAQTITYALKDSLITLLRHSEVTSGDMSLEAHRVLFNTKYRVVEAFSAEVPGDTTRSASTFASRLQPNSVPVVLKDKADVLYGDYLVYAIDTRKGRILKSKSKYETGFFYGNDLYRQQKDVYYLEGGRYTTCDANEPHFHFYSKHLKLVQNDRLIAKPVVLSIGRLPILALPYYVFPLKKGRHSGILPFTLGNIEQGQRYIRNVGYYWAASEYWDAQAALDYYEQNSTVNLFGRMSYARRYTYSGYISGNYTRVVNPPTIASGGQERKSTRWTLAGAHSHQFSPTFRMAADGNYQSDKSFYRDYSTDLNDRLNRVVRSKVNFSKRFGKSYSISGTVAHDEYLDQRKRVDQIPTLTFSSTRLYPFGSGKVDAEGKLRRRFYNNLLVTYQPGVVGYSDRTVDTLDQTHRKKYLRVNHGIGFAMPMTVAKYFTLSPGGSYNEAWYRIFRTDRSDSLGIGPDQFYRAYAYSFGASLNTKIYGTVYPKVFGVTGLRQVITPSVSYSYVPEINRHEVVRNFAGGGPGNSRTAQRLTFSLDHSYQARVRAGEKSERSLQLLSINHSLAYDMEAKEYKFSDLNTSFSSTLMPRINLTGGAVHSLYRPGTKELRFWSPTLESFNLNLTFSLAGKSFIFDDLRSQVPRGADSANQIPSAGVGPSGGETGWSMRVDYRYSESGRGSLFTKSSFLNFHLDFNLTPSTRISYDQSYDVRTGHTVYNSVRIGKQLHCWNGEFYWVPTGSTRGYGFRLFVIAIPAIKLDNTQSVVSSSYIQGFNR